MGVSGTAFNLRTTGDLCLGDFTASLVVQLAHLPEHAYTTFLCLSQHLASYLLHFDEVGMDKHLLLAKQPSVLLFKHTIGHL